MRVVVVLVVVRDTKFKACCVACAGYARQSRNRSAQYVTQGRVVVQGKHEEMNVLRSSVVTA